MYYPSCGGSGHTIDAFRGAIIDTNRRMDITDTRVISASKLLILILDDHYKTPLLLEASIVFDCSTTHSISVNRHTPFNTYCT